MLQLNLLQLILKIFFIVVDFEHVDPQCDTSDEDFELLG